jgi:hypothetical protein
MGAEDALRLLVPGARQELRGPHQIGEEERHQAGRPFGHPEIMPGRGSGVEERTAP